ncbi:MAG TPA: sigma-70 family RNA polymerase sigma factor [Phycisphaerae bacterium]|nr:sigma-70 family RNA polymerase sigma factor [Phycisphaerae bacterium]
MERPLATTSSDRAAGASNAPPAAAAAPSDDHLVAQLKRGNVAAMEGLVLKYQDRLFGCVYRIVGHPDDAADLVQETFVRLLQNIHKFEGKSALYTWLFRIAVNLALTQRRAGRYRAAVSLDHQPDEAADLNRQAAPLRRLAQDREADPAAAAALRLDHERVLAALGRLDPEFRAVIILRDVEDCDYEQMAQVLEVPVGTIKSRLFRARSALREAVNALAAAGAPPASA